MASEPETMESEGGVISRSPNALRVRSDGPSWIQIEHGFGKSAVLILWLSSMISGAALIGLIATCFFIYKSIGYTAVLEYDLMDLRAKVGEAHENTPSVETDEVE